MFLALRTLPHFKLILLALVVIILALTSGEVTYACLYIVSFIHILFSAALLDPKTEL